MLVRVCLLLSTLAAVVLPGAVLAQPSGSSTSAVRIIFVGDVMLDGGPGHLITTGGDPFADVAAVLKDADLTIANLECAVTTDGEVVRKSYTFKAPKSALPILTRYFSAVSLANNHSADWGSRGLVNELTLLNEAKLPHFGGGVNLAQAREPLIMTRNGLRVAFLGYNGFHLSAYAAGRSTPGVAPLDEAVMLADIKGARTKNHADLVILVLHWGVELEAQPTPEQQALARRLIDAGADAIIGGHPHVTQTIEWHKGHPIIYSLGNFVFDYFPTDPPVWLGWIARLTIGEPEGVKVETRDVEMDPEGVPHLQSKEWRDATR